MKTIHVEDKMQRDYTYCLVEPMGKNFDPKFTPELTPKKMLQLGVFGGKYLNDCKQEFPDDWFKNAKLSKQKDIGLNYFEVDASLPLSEWQRKGWIHHQDPRGWFQWYCRYYMGRRTDDDERQIKRWNNFCGEKGRWRNYIYSKINKRGTSTDDISFSLAVRQSLLHWGYMINNGDFDMWKEHNSF